MIIDEYVQLSFITLTIIYLYMRYNTTIGKNTDTNIDNDRMLIHKSGDDNILLSNVKSINYLFENNKKLSYDLINKINFHNLVYFNEILDMNDFELNKLTFRKIATK
jgi:hypothetical protein